jgi:acetyl esterase/lipase
MQSGTGSAASAATTLPRLSDLYDPNGVFEVRSRDLEYRNDSTGSYLARVHEPVGAGPFPAILEVHGGAWNHYDRFQNEPQNQILAASGIVVVAVEFRLGAEGKYPKSIADVNYAARWLKHRAGDFNAVSDGIGSIGYSSGGHMAMLVAMKPHDPRYAAIPYDAAPDIDASLAYVIMPWPPIDPLARYRYSQGINRESMLDNHHAYWGDEAAMADGNPQMILDRGEKVELPPTLILQGSEDVILGPGLAERFAPAYAQAGGLVELAMYPGVGHGFMREPGPTADRAMALTKSFIARQFQAIDAGR